MRLFQQALPFGFPEACQDCFAVNDDRPLDEHTVGRKQAELFFFGHGGEPVFQIHGLVQQAAGVEKTLERQAAHFVP